MKQFTKIIENMLNNIRTAINITTSQKKYQRIKQTNHNNGIESITLLGNTKKDTSITSLNINDEIITDKSFVLRLSSRLCFNF